MKEEKLQSKIDLVTEIKDQIDSAQSIVLVNYRGLSVEGVTELRKKLREQDVNYKVYKNTMIRRAFHELGHEELDEFLVGPTAIAFGTADAVAPAKVLSDYADDNDEIELKVGFMDGKVIDVDGIKALAKLPPKEVLIAQVLGGLNSPIQGLANVLTGNLSGLARVLNAVKEKKEQEEAA